MILSSDFKRFSILSCISIISSIQLINITKFLTVLIKQWFKSIMIRFLFLIKFFFYLNMVAVQYTDSQF